MLKMQTESEFTPFARDCLDIHNTWRKKHAVPPLELKKELCDFAFEWCEVLAKKGKMEHRPKNPYGENIYFYYNSDKTILPTADMAVQAWYDEINNYDFKKETSQKGTGHFTQMIWKETKYLGVAFAQNTVGYTYVVANYDPPGNFVGEFKENVLPILASFTRKTSFDDDKKI